MNLSKKLYLILLTFSTQVFPLLMVAQENPNENPVQGLLDSLWVQRPVEKLYVQLDKERYVAGESLWFKTYLLEGKDLNPSYLSNLVYVECWDPTDSLIARKTIRLEGGTGTGDLALGKDIPGGIYRLQAYTQWMRNYVRPFQTSIQILNPTLKHELPEKQESKPDIQFLPESGSLLAGGENKVAFKALGSDGWGVFVEGKIKDASGQEVQGFRAEHRGMGSFSFTPEAGNRYQAEIEWKGATLNYPLPSVEEKGFSLQVNSSPFITQVHIRSHGLAPNSVVQLAGLMGHRLRILLKARLQEGKAQLDIPNSFFDTGVLQLTLLDGAGVALCERMVWIDKQDQLNIELSPNQPSFSQRSLVDISFKTQSPTGEGLPTQLAVSVFEENGAWEDSPFRNSLESHMLLASEGKGHIEAPWEYFHQEEIEQHLDLVMLTHFWRKINWEDLGNVLAAPSHFIERDLTVSGRVMRNKNKGLPNSTVILMMGDMFHLRETQSDEKGYFSFHGLGFDDTTQLMLQARTSKNVARPAIFLVDEKSYEAAPGTPIVAPSPFANLDYIRRNVQQQANIEAFDGIFQYDLEGVEITTKKQDPDVSDRGSRLYRKPTMRVDMAKQYYRTNVIEALKGKVPGIDITGQPGSYQIRVRGSSSFVLSNEPLFLVDGMAVDITYAEALPMPLVDYVDVIKGPQAAIFGEDGANGVIAIYMKDGIDDLSPETDEQRGIHRPSLTGLSVGRSFYSPSYLIADPRHDLPDLRSTLLWQPYIQTEEDGTYSLQFHTGDVPGKYRIVVEGISPGGKMGYATGSIEVR